MIEGVPGGEHGAAVLNEGQPDEVVSGDDEACFALRRDANDAALTAKAGGDVEIVFEIEGHALGAAESLEEDGGVAVAVDGVNSLIGRGGGPGDEERPLLVEGEVIGGDGGLERG